MSRGIYPRYAVHEVDIEHRLWFVRQQGVGPLKIVDVTDVCATFGVSAHLYDRRGADGVCVGRVDGRGEVELYAPEDQE